MLNSKLQITNYKQKSNTNIQRKSFDLEERTLNFARAIIRLCESLKKTTGNVELAKQLIRSGTSIGANYREANESLGKKDFLHRMKITRKEAKETSYWLELLYDSNTALTSDIDTLLQESRELRNIFTSIIRKTG